MPRRTHPDPVSKHTRAHVRAQRERVIRSRWRHAKLWYPERAIVVTAGLAGELAPIVFVHPDADDPVLMTLARWPFNRPRGSFTRNPHNHCACMRCTRDERVEPRRARENRELRDLIADELGDQR